MEPADPSAFPSRPRGAGAAYGSVIRETETPRDIEYRVLARTTALLEAATAEGAGPAALPTAVHDNRMLWTAFATDLAHAENAWDDAGKARLISLAAWVMAESDRVLRGTKAPQALIDINRTIMQGLKPVTQMQPEGKT
ncbi:flagellar biosynthesis regulator FlaF [Paracraurococcus lichenis]|uniref:Flagellar biosynthesis regulator FlaF n=1 Tax=Paracraurococcus lichenis TaxID=3064888 RepID=A0ABT9E6L5_9PROT|nr:flagellar biosynthesis regulator FlaF [Paracraurococcus sp. LOR1-02]MDO9711798.1 flagellar biosynthesis regulator FlaF [Paracraurococcus sp. LOR1-02]